MTDRIIKTTDPDFPEQLHGIKEPVSRLYYRGDISVLEKDAVAVVGTRKPGDGTKEEVFSLVKGLVDQGFVIVSGLALGVDTFAHEATLEYGGRTVAVLPSGLDAIAPKQNLGLSDRILESGGLLLTEYESTASPKKYTYVKRNRIQAALSLAVIVVESAVDGGTMYTAGFAREYGRLLAVVDRIDAGGNVKLRDEGAIRLSTRRSYDSRVMDIGSFCNLMRDPLRRFEYTLNSRIREGQVGIQSTLKKMEKRLDIFDDELNETLKRLAALKRESNQTKMNDYF